jgi:hypothetical protein
MKKVKIDPIKVIEIKPRMVKEGAGMSPILLMIIGIVLMVLGISLFSCKEQTPQEIEEPIGLRQKSDDRHKNVTEFTYGGCEYIRVGYGQSAWGSHKGNCANPIHKGQHPSPYMLESSALEHYENKNPR